MNTISVGTRNMLRAWGSTIRRCRHVLNLEILHHDHVVGINHFRGGPVTGIANHQGEPKYTGS